MEAAATPAGSSVPLIEMRRIAKYYGAVAALREVDFAVRRGEVVALLGDNGAGKSTLIKILAGVLAADGGQILVDGRPASISGPKGAKTLGIQTVYQDLALCDNLDVPANIFLGRELRKSLLGRQIGWFDRRAMAEETRALLDRLRIEIDDLGTIVRHLSGGQRQSVAIAKSVYGNARVVIMDEPTAALGVAQTAKVLALVGDLRAAGLAIVYISHNMVDVFEVADRMVVLKNGRLVGERRRDETDRDEIVRLIIAGEPGPTRERAA
jgi:D-xylose transport system ATP-binding protein